MVCKGVVRGGIVELQAGADLPDGAQVTVLLEEETAAEDRAPVPSLASLLEALEQPPLCSPEDVDILVESIRSGRRRSLLPTPISNG